MISALSIYAGPVALDRIREEGLRAGLFEAMLGASGGPKWFILLGLDRYLFGEFFAGRDKPLYTLGSSAGAWRLSCLASTDPVGAIERLADRYSHERYSPNPGLREITDNARRMVGNVFSRQDLAHIAGNRVFLTHIIADRAVGLAATGIAALQAMHLGLSAAANVISRRGLGLFYRRCIFSPEPSRSVWSHLRDLPTEYYRLTEQNLFDVMLATGSIPFVLEGVKDIPGAAPGVYWDGGITDYHLDVAGDQVRGLVLYPHFTDDLVPGWFDKKLPWRSVRAANYENVVLLCPSREFVAALPHGKIPNRTDFNTMAYDERVVYWQKVLDQSRHLADEFSRLVETGAGLDAIQPLNNRPGR